mmetsp:Transcript_18169/g.31071  ORF Transcript_18169/g.31071 Transcript_18169/m.31071 type:complete len:145 (+) Transcript_18169:971-1405(+)
MVVAFSVFSILSVKRSDREEQQHSVSISDFSLFFPVSEKLLSYFERWRAQSEKGYLERGQAVPARGVLFKKCFNELIEVEGACILQIQLSFDNAQVLALLEDRGAAFSDQNLERLRAAESSLWDYQQSFQHNEVTGIFVIYETH